MAAHATAAQLERVVRAYRGVLGVEDATRAHEERFVSLSQDADGSWLLRGRLAAEDGALLARALDAAREDLRPPRVAAGTPSGSDAEAGVPAETPCGSDAEAGVRAETPCDAGTDAPVQTRPERDVRAATSSDSRADARASAETSSGSRAEAPVPAETPLHPGGARTADALVLLADTLLAHGPAGRSAGDRYQVVVHAEAAALSAAPEADHRCELEEGGPLAAQTAQRLACDASIVTMTERDGRPLSVGRKTRSVPPALRRALRRRDVCCRFPGCTQRRWLDAHHIHHWAHGGSTALDNLVHLCRYHHRLLHEGGFSLESAAGGKLTFRDPRGRVLHPAPRSRGGDCSEIRRAARIGPETCARGTGERFDLGGAVDIVLAATSTVSPPDASAGTPVGPPDASAGTPAAAMDSYVGAGNGRLGGPGGLAGA